MQRHTTVDKANWTVQLGLSCVSQVGYEKDVGVKVAGWSQNQFIEVVPETRIE